MPLHWHADGKPLHLNDDWEATITSAGGFEQLTATADRDDVRKLHQGSGIAATTKNGREVWFGNLDATPAISRLPVARLTATGPVAKVRAIKNNWLAQSRDYGMWKPESSDPYAYASSERIQADSQGGRLVFRVTTGTDIKTNNQNGLAAWFPGEAITNVAFAWDSNVASTDHKLQIWTGTGPSGTLTQRGGDISLNASSGTVNQALTTDDDLIAIRLIWVSANTTTTVHYGITLRTLRVNGRTSGDSTAPGDIISDMASSVNLGTSRVESSGQNALPFYWEGGSWGDAFSELAGLDDWPWLVDRKGVVYGPWDNTWSIDFSQENEDLDFPPIYNRVRVFYTTLAGAPRSVRVEASPDPLAKFDVDKEYQYDLNQSYADDDIPTAVANALLDKVSAQRVVGTVTVTHGHRTGRVWTQRRTFSTFADDHYLITPGTTARLTPYPKLGPQRITGVRLRADGVTVEFGEDAESAATRLLAKVALGRARATPKRK